MTAHRRVARSLLRACAGLAPGVALAAVATASGPGAVGTRAEQRWPGAVRELAAGKLLVAARNLPDPNFAETVVLLADYGPDGAMGVILNRRTEVPLAQAFPELRRIPADAAPLYLGGPVAATGVLALLRAEGTPEGGRAVLPGVHLITTREPLEAAITATTDPDRLRVYLGYAGWGPRQLDAETAEGVWHVLEADADLVFDREPGSLWRRQIARTEERLAGGSGLDQVSIRSGSGLDQVWIGSALGRASNGVREGRSGLTPEVPVIEARL